jgi:aspartyl/asparaginyl beta-hydroxylase (cupin superfamily)
MVRLYGLTGLRSVIAFAIAQVCASVAACVGVAYAAAYARDPVAQAAAAAVAGAVFVTQFQAWSLLSQTLMSMNVGLPQRFAFLRRARYVVPTALAPALVAAPAAYARTADGAASAAAGVAAFLVAIGLGSTLLSLALLRQALEARTWRGPIVNIWEGVLEQMRQAGRATEQLVEFVERERNGPRCGDDMAMGTAERVRAGLVRHGGAGFNDVRGYLLPGLRTRPVHDPDDFPFVKLVRERYGQMKREVEQLYGSLDRLEQYPFANVKRWRSIPLYKGGVRIDRYADQVPALMDVVENHIPGATIREVVLSCLESGGLIEPHFDNVLPLLTLHVPFDVPEGGAAGIRVGNEVVTWREGEPVVIDTSFEHEAWNHGATPRLNLLLDFWHPDASPEVREFFSIAYRKQMERHL